MNLARLGKEMNETAAQKHSARKHVALSAQGNGFTFWMGECGDVGVGSLYQRQPFGGTLDFPKFDGREAAHLDICLGDGKTPNSHSTNTGTHPRT